MTQHPSRGMRAQTLIVLIVLVSYGAVGARQPAVRTSIRLPVPAAELAANLGLHPDDRAGLLTSIVRLVFDAPDGGNAEDERRRAILDASLQRPPRDKGDLVPLPLDPSVWRETLLQRNVADADLAGAIFSERSTALLYHGLAALDDETLAWVGPERETLVHLRRNAAVFATFGRSVTVRAGRVAVPGGPDAEATWAALVGADPAHPTAFVQRLIRGTGRLAWLYDTVMHLEPSHRTMLLGKGKGPLERLRELLAVFESVAPEWQVPQRPFVRPASDPALMLSLLAVDDRGTLRGPSARSLWNGVFSDGRTLMPTSPGAGEAAAASESASVDAAWLARRFSQAPAAAGKRRFETFLFGQRVFGELQAGDRGDLLVALRGAALFPALAMTLERIGITDPGVYAAAARTAASLDAIRSAEWRQTSTVQFQAAVAIIDRARRMGGLDREAAADLVASLVAVEPSSEHGYGSALSEWIHRELAGALPAQHDSRDRVEDAILAACAGVRERDSASALIEWEGRRYRVDPAAGELKRLRRIRERQRSAAPTSGPLDAQLALAPDAGALAARLAREGRIAEALTAIVYAFYLGEADGAAAGDAAGRHDLGLGESAGAHAAAVWRVAREEHGSRAGWRVVGSLLGLDVGLGRLALRRLDVSDMPAEPAMSTSERTAATWTAALFGPIHPEAATPPEIAAAIARGRAAVAEIGGDRSRVADVVERAGLSEWRREALRWTIANEPEKAESHFSLLELLWLGSRLDPSALDPWGAARLSLDGSLLLRMPRPQLWESLGRRPSAGHLASVAADVGLRVALALADLKLPAAVAPAVMAYAVQDVIDAAQPAYFDDWPAFQRTARDVPRDRIVDYVSAAGAGGMFVPLPGPSN